MGFLRSVPAGSIKVGSGIVKVEGAPNEAVARLLVAMTPALPAVANEVQRVLIHGQSPTVAEWLSKQPGNGAAVGHTIDKATDSEVAITVYLHTI